MPPKKFRHQLSDREKAILKKWVEQGAEYEDHWAYITPKRPDVPKDDSGWALNPIDNFIARKHRELGLKPAPPADPNTLLRRLSLDITGLPPTIDEVASFRKSAPPNPNSAIGDAVDRLLASPHYGERMAVFWLDLARYADTVGYHGDQERDVSPYRDYVIAAFNQNMPYDQFVTEQLAGDLLENPTISQRVATAFNRLNQISSEGGIQDAEYIAKTYSERVRTVSNAFLGSTMGCAECHDHKFDPFSAADFYSFAAFFADIHEKGAYTGDGRYNDNVDMAKIPGGNLGKWGPAMTVPNPDAIAEFEKIDAQIIDLEQKLKTGTPEVVASFEKWIASLKANADEPAPADHILIEDKGELHGYAISAKFVDKKAGPVNTGQFSRHQSDGKLVQHIVDIAKKPYTVSDGDTLFCDVYLDPKNPPTQVMLQFHGAAWAHRAYWGKADIPYGKDTGESTQHHRVGDLPETGKWIRLEVPAAAVGFKPGDKIVQVAYTQPGGSVYWDQAGISTKSAAFRGLPADIVKSIREKKDLNPDQRTRALTHYGTIAPEFAPVRNEIANLKTKQAELGKAARETLITVSAKPREVRVLPRGNWMDKSGEVRMPAFPEFLSKNEPAPDADRLTRLDLASWITAKENPLTARTLVNRLWYLYFGRGLSRVLDDLGSQGDPPSHPELLDWLAVELVESGWDIKHIIKLITTSATYQQSSGNAPAYASQKPRRLAAEFIRDNALAVSGLLVRDIGGRSVRPYQPAGYYEHLNFPRRTYKPDTGPNQYRRGLYTHWQRTFLHPAMVAFDAPARDECTADRADSNTPLQALALLNDPSQTEAARALGALMLAEGKSDPAGVLPWAFKRVLAREPSPEELAVLNDLKDKTQARLKADPAATESLVKIGNFPIPPETDKVALATATTLARALLNLHETITRY